MGFFRKKCAGRGGEEEKAEEEADETAEVPGKYERCVLKKVLRGEDVSMRQIILKGI